MKRILIVIDMQNDFITGALPADGGVEIVPRIVDKIKNGNYEKVFYTQDYHSKIEYYSSLEGDSIPGHCFVGTEGFELVKEIADTVSYSNDIIFKNSFGSYLYLANMIDIVDECWPIGNSEIELCGVCTDICVISNALILRAAFPNTRIIVDSSCCAGTTKEAHEAALKVMKNCLIEVI